MLLHRFAQRHRPTAAVATVSAVGITMTAGCGAAASHSGGPAVIVLRNDANGKAVSARAGDRIKLILSSSYWHVTGSSPPRVLHVVRLCDATQTNRVLPSASSSEIRSHPGLTIIRVPGPAQR